MQPCIESKGTDGNKKQYHVIWVYLSGMKYAHRSLRFESLSKAESSVAGLVLLSMVLAIPHSDGEEDRIRSNRIPCRSSLDSMEPCRLIARD